MSFTVQEARAAFSCCKSLTPHHVGGSKIHKQGDLLEQRWRPESVRDARDLIAVQGAKSEGE